MPIWGGLNAHFGLILTWFFYGCAKPSDQPAVEILGLGGADITSVRVAALPVGASAVVGDSAGGALDGGWPSCGVSFVLGAPSPRLPRFLTAGMQPVTVGLVGPPVPMTHRVGRRAELAAVVAGAGALRHAGVGGRVGRVWRPLDRRHAVTIDRRHAVTIGLPKMLISVVGGLGLPKLRVLGGNPRNPGNPLFRLLPATVRRGFWRFRGFRHEQWVYAPAQGGAAAERPDLRLQRPEPAGANKAINQLFGASLIDRAPQCVPTNVLKRRLFGVWRPLDRRLELKRLVSTIS